MQTIVHADVVAVGGRPPLLDVKVLRIQDGALIYRTGGTEARRPLEQLDYVQITGWQVFNLAEKQQRDGHHRQAIALYETVLKELSEPSQPAKNATPPPELDRLLLARARLMRVCEVNGRFDRAVELFLQLLESSGGTAWFEPLRPRNLPSPDASSLSSARNAIQEAIARHANDEIATLLARWLATWPAPPQAPVSSRPAMEGSGIPDHLRSILAEIAALVQTGRNDDALRRIEPLQTESSGAVRADLYYWQGRALLARSGQTSASATIVDARRAGIAFMRVVIHYPGHARAAESLFSAGQIARSQGSVAQAAALWSELVSVYPDASPWTQQAARALEQLKPTSAPAR